MMTRAAKQAFITSRRPALTDEVLSEMSSDAVAAHYDALHESADVKAEIAAMQAEHKRQDAWKPVSQRRACEPDYLSQSRVDSHEDVLAAAEYRRLHAWKIGQGRADAFDPTQPQTSAGVLNSIYRRSLDAATSPEERARIAQAIIDARAEHEAEKDAEERNAKAEVVAEDERKIAAQRARERAAANGSPLADNARGDSFDAQLAALETKRQNQWRTGPSYEISR